jgi:Holliday junction DNA helicase RuvB
MLADEGAVRTCDLLMESMKLWIGHVVAHLWSGDPADFEPAAVFLDTETDIEGEIRRDGSVIHLRGRPDAVFFDQRCSEVHVWEYKFGRQGLFELQVAQTLLYMALIESVKGVTTAGGQLALFSVEVEEASGSASEESSRVSFPPKVERAFEGFIGNRQAVYLLKMELTLALKENPPRFRKNILLCGPGGTGKTELARRVAGALGTPLVDVPATVVSGLDDLIAKVDAVLAHEHLSAVEDGTDPHSGKPLFRYPPILVFIDEVHSLRKPDAFLNLLETKDRRAVCKDKTCDLMDAAFLAATTEKGKLFKPFLSRFRVIDLQRYTLGEVAAIARLVFADFRKDCPKEVAELLAKAGRLTPRTVKIRAEDFVGYNEVDPRVYPISESGVREAMRRLWNVDSNGLTPMDKEYLEAVSAGPKGISTLTKLLPCAREEIENVIEPYLLQLRAVRQTSKGREITEIGRSMLDGQ